MVMDTAQYIKEGYEHLADTTIYKQLDKDRTLEVAQKTSRALHHHQAVGTLPIKQKANLHTSPVLVRTQEMYFLRKVHKDPHKIRPIVSCSSGPTEKISAYLCHVLTPHFSNVKSLVTNSQHVVEGLDLTPSERDSCFFGCGVTLSFYSTGCWNRTGIEADPTIKPTSTRKKLQELHQRLTQNRDQR